MRLVTTPFDVHVCPNHTACRSIAARPSRFLSSTSTIECVEGAGEEKNEQAHTDIIGCSENSIQSFLSLSLSLCVVLGTHDGSCAEPSLSCMLMHGIQFQPAWLSDLIPGTNERRDDNAPPVFLSGLTHASSWILRQCTTQLRISHVIPHTHAHAHDPSTQADMHILPSNDRRAQACAHREEFEAYTIQLQACADMYAK